MDNSDISGKSHAGYEEPLFYWDPSIATSNIDFIENKSSAWFGNLLVAGLKTQSILG
jgi:glucose/arabinose dehydrogenase